MKSFIIWLFLLTGYSCYTQTTPTIQFTLVPDWGNTSFLQGKVHNTTMNDHGVAVYIFVEEAGGWWNKPYSSSPVTVLQSDSTFNTNIVTGGLDQYATKIIAFLIPLTYSPPILSGGNLPGILFSNPYDVTCRPHGDRIISWSGLDWVVKRSVGSTLLPIGPGPNIFNGNDTMVWVDSQKRLHLRIAKNGNEWHCSEIICKTSLGYKRYEFEFGNRVDMLDPNIVAGIFTWDDCSPFAQPPNNYFREIDMEFSRWGAVNNEDSQYVIQPYDFTGNMNRFNMNLTGVDHSDHSFTWTADSISFKSAWGDSSYSWKYTNPVYIPIPGKENVRINLWLFNGSAPLDNQNSELILNSFISGIGAVNNYHNNYINIFPNPFKNKCLIDTHSDSSKEIEIGLIDLQGNLICRIFEGKLNQGSNKIEWDGRIDNGNLVKQGLYLIYLKEKSGTEYFKVLKM